MKNKPISKDFKITLLQVLQKGYMTGTDRERIEDYLRTYFDGWQPPELEPLSSEDMAELILHYEEQKDAATIEGVVSSYERLTGKRINMTTQHG
jgi:hypothetical protein